MKMGVPLRARRGECPCHLCCEELYITREPKRQPEDNLVVYGAIFVDQNVSEPAHRAQRPHQIRGKHQCLFQPIEEVFLLCRQTETQSSNEKSTDVQYALHGDLQEALGGPPFFK